MKRLWVVVAIAVPLALFWAARESASWRPARVGTIGSTPALWEKAGFSPDGRFLIVQSRNSNTPAILWDMKSVQKRVLPQGKVFLSPEGEFAPSRLTFSPDSRTLAIINDWHKATPLLDVLYRSRARFYRLEEGRSPYSARVPEALSDNWISDAAFSSDGKIFTLATRRYFYRFDAANGQLLKRVKPRFQSRYSNFSPDATRVLQEFDGRSLIRDLNGGKELILPGSSQNSRMGWSPDGKICWQAKPYNTGFLFWSAQTGASIRDWQTEAQTKIHFTPDSQQLAVATSQGLELREVATGKLVRTLPGPRAEPFAIAPDGLLAISVDAQGILWKWRLK